MLGFITTLTDMDVLLIDPFHGAAGDMIIGAMLDLGVPEKPVREAIESVADSPNIYKVNRAGIQAVKIDTNTGPASRTLDEVLKIVDRSGAPKEAVDMASRVFKRIDAAETSVHGKKTHFHEVGADDAIADVLGACTALTLIAPNKVVVMPVSTGTGTVSMAHGLYPVPAPATLEILKDSELLTNFDFSNGELCTPTGAALLAEFCDSVSERPVKGRVVSTGYGAGSRNPENYPNVLRMVLVKEDSDQHEGVVDLLETNVDDVSGEVIGNTIAKLIGAGARDVSAVPCVMKKGRTGHLIRVVSMPEDSERLSVMMAEELGTLGVRCIPSLHRFAADRTFDEVEVEFKLKNSLVKKEKFKVKYGWHDGVCYRIKAEYEPARVFADENGIPVRDVIRMIEEEAGKMKVVDK